MLKVLLIIFCTYLVTKAKICRKEKFEYYHYQSSEDCLRCDKCIKGEGRDPTKVVPSIPGKGATECSPCEPCPAGYFNKKEAWQCRPCRDCSELNMDEIRSCTSKRNAKCSPRSRVENPSNIQNFENTTQFMVLNSDKDQSEKKAVAGETSTRQEGLPSGVLIFGIVIAVPSILGALIGYTWRKKNAGGVNPEQRCVPNYESRSSNNCEEARDCFLAPVREDGDNITSTSSFLTDSQFRVDETIIDIDETIAQSSSHEDREHTFLKKPVSTEDLEETFITKDIDQVFVKKHVSTMDIEQTFVKKPVSTEDLSQNSRRMKVTGTFMLSTEQDRGIGNRPQLLQNNIDNDIFADASPIPLPSKRDNNAEKHDSFRNDDERQCNSLTNSPTTTEPDLNLNLLYWSRNLAAERKYRVFALKAGISKTDLSIIEEDFPNNVREQAYQVLVKWKHQLGKLATRPKFYSILTEINHSVGLQKQ